jgi:hypothetical protein
MELVILEKSLERTIKNKFDFTEGKDHLSVLNSLSSESVFLFI